MKLTRKGYSGRYYKDVILQEESGIYSFLQLARNQQTINQVRSRINKQYLELATSALIRRAQ
jgi:hypothetical protein